MYSVKTLIIHNVLRNEKNTINKIFLRNYTPRRAMLYVPGDSKKKIEKAMNMQVDSIIMDCEDGVAITQKSKARDNIHMILNKGRHHPAEVKTEQGGSKLVHHFDWAVRVNPANSVLVNEDLAAILTAKHKPDTLVLPKVTSVDDIKMLSEKIRNQKAVAAPLNLMLLIESATAMINLPSICQLSKSSDLFKVAGLIFGSDDFCASIGAVRTEDCREIIYARQKLVLVAKAYNLQAIDMVYIDYKDTFGLRNDCIASMKMGYTGKQVIHPKQVPIAQEAFLPSKVQVDWAVGLIEAFTEHQKKGIGAFSYKNSMIDMPTVKIAQNIVDTITKTKPQEQQ